MSQQSIADKAQIIRTETQKYGNTRQRVADVLDDINTTKANSEDLSALDTSMQNADSALAQSIQDEATTRANADSALSQDIQNIADNIDSIQQELSDINAEQVQQNTSISSKLDKPNSDGSYYITKITIAGTSYYQYRPISLSSGQIPVSRGSYIGESLLYESVIGRIGLDTPNPSEKFEVYNGRVKADGFILTSSAVAPLPREIKFKGGNFVGAKDDGIERKFLMEGDLDTELATKLDKGGYTGTAQELKNSIDSKLDKPTTTSNTTSYPFVVGENGNGGSARLPAGDLGKNFFNSDLSNTTARNHTMNAGVTVNTLGNPHTLSGLPNKNADITNFRKVRVQNASGLDSVVDSKNLLTDGMTSMTDAEKDAWRLAQRKSNENYNTAAPQISVINPFLIKNTDDFPLSVVVTGSSLFIDLSNSIVTMKRVMNINGEAVSDQPINVTNNVTASSTNNAVLLIYYNFHNATTGYYELKIQNHYGLQNLTSPQFLIVENYDLTPMLPFTVINSSNDLVNNTTINNNSFEVNLVPNVYGGILFNKLYDSINGDINCTFDLDLAIIIPKSDYFFGEILLGLINNDYTNNVSSTTFPKIGFKLSQPNRYTLIITDINTKTILQNFNWSNDFIYYLKFKIFIKDGTYIITNIVTGQVSQGFYNDFNELRFLISKNYPTTMAGGRLSVSVLNFKKI